MSAALQRADATPTAPPAAGGLRSLFGHFHHYRAAGTRLVLATVLTTSGTTYRKRGACMLIRGDDHWHGLLSGGCLEGDLAAHAREVFASGAARVVDYDLAAMTDAVWGFGLGCDGSVRILLQRLDAANGWEPFASIAQHVEEGTGGTLTLLGESTDPRLPVGTWKVDSSQGTAGPLAAVSLPAGIGEDAFAIGDHTYRCARFDLPRLPRLVILGAGPDAEPLVQFASQLGWHITVADHRAAYANAAHFPGADRVVHAPEQHLPAEADLSTADAIVVMSHNLAADERYLTAAAATSAKYIGLLGPAARKHRLLASLPEATNLAKRVHGPVGLDLGGEGPEAIALSIVAEIQAVLHGKVDVMRSGGSEIKATPGKL